MRTSRVLDKIKEQRNFAEILREKIKTGKETISELNSEAKNDKKLLDVCYEMESLFIGNMLKSMRKTVMESGFFGKSIAKDIFRDMLYDEYAKSMARTGQLGLAKQIYNQLSV
ncbi:MAG: rod-binding protein [Spirochaetes bacterium]|nr:rod-binding protein [Spirochaetota bacterium]